MERREQAIVIRGDAKRKTKVKYLKGGKGKRRGKKCGGSYISAGYNCRKNTRKNASGKRKLTGAGKASARELADKLRQDRGLKKVLRPGDKGYNKRKETHGFRNRNRPDDRPKLQSPDAAKATMSVAARRLILRGKFNDTGGDLSRSESLRRKTEGKVDGMVARAEKERLEKKSRSKVVDVDAANKDLNSRTKGLKEALESTDEALNRAKNVGKKSKNVGESESNNLGGIPQYIDRSDREYKLQTPKKYDRSKSRRSVDSVEILEADKDPNYYRSFDMRRNLRADAAVFLASVQTEYDAVVELSNGGYVMVTFAESPPIGLAESINKFRNKVSGIDLEDKLYGHSMSDPPYKEGKVPHQYHIHATDHYVSEEVAQAVADALKGRGMEVKLKDGRSMPRGKVRAFA